MTDDKLEIQNVGQPGKTYRVDRVKYEAMRDALVQVLPNEAPGTSVADLKEQVVPLLPDDLFPGGSTAGWWLKAVHLDLEAKGIIARSVKPVRLYLV